MGTMLEVTREGGGGVFNKKWASKKVGFSEKVDLQNVSF